MSTFSARNHLVAVLFVVSGLVAVGCGKSAPPPGAPSTAAPATVEMGTESAPGDAPAGTPATQEAPNDAGGASTPSAEAAGTPPAGQTESK
jgi:hypothetical protein